MRPIDADALMDELPVVEADKNISLYGAVADVVVLIDKAPTLDVAPVVHGRWIGLEYDGYADGFPVYDLWECSECGEEQRGEDVPDTHLYCPNCGAKMDMEDNADD